MTDKQSKVARRDTMPSPNEIPAWYEIAANVSRLVTWLYEGGEWSEGDGYGEVDGIIYLLSKPYKWQREYEWMMSGKSYDTIPNDVLSKHD